MTSFETRLVGMTHPGAPGLSVGFSEKLRVLVAVALSAAWMSGGSAIGGQGQEETGDSGGHVVVEGQVFDHNGGGVTGVEVALVEKPYREGAKPLAVARTDHYGDFKIAHEQPLSGVFLIVFKKEGHAEVRQDVEIVPGDLPPFVDLELPGDLTLSGKITGKLKGEPVAGATVSVNLAGREWTATSDELGVFQIKELPPGRGSLAVRAEGFGRETTDVELPADGERLTIELKPERIVRIETVDAEGIPIAGVTVECHEETRNDYRSLLSDEHGTAEVRGIHLDATTLRVRLTHEQFVSDRRFDRELALPGDARESSHRLTLSAAGSISGTITDAAAQTPLNGVRVMVGTDLDGDVLQDWTGFDGTYHIKGVTPGATAVTTYLNGLAAELVTITVQANQKNTADFALNSSKEAGGVVVDEEGKPVSGAILYATKWRGYASLGVQTLTGATGRFSLFSIPDDPFQVSITAAGFESLDDQVIEPGRSDHRFVLARRSEVEPGAAKLKLGEPFPILNMVTLDGALIKPADLKGKTVLFDFWATWCAPCVVEVPNLVAVNDAFGHRKDFMIISVSLDAQQDEKKLRAFIAKKKMNWVHVFGDAKNVEEINRACGVQAIPATFLVGPDGTLRAMDLHGRQMKDQVAAVLDADAGEAKP